MSKDEFMKSLKEAGFKADYANNGIPTIFVDTPDEIMSANDKIREFITQQGYTQSFGIGVLKQSLEQIA